MKNSSDNLNNLKPTSEELLLFSGMVEAEMQQELYGEETENDSVDCLKLYFNEMGRKKILTAQQEQELGKMIREGGENAMWARNELVSTNLRLAVHYAKRFQGRGVELEDLISMANEGLLRAAEKYDYAQGFRFSTYASWWIFQCINRGIAAEGSTMRIPVHMADQINKVRKARKMLLQEYGAEPTAEEIAQNCGLSVQEVNTALQSAYTTVSFDSKVKEDSDTTYGDFLMDEKAVDPCENAVDIARREAVRKVLSLLSDNEALILSMRKGIGYDHPMTLEEIGSLPDFHLSRERIRQIETRTIEKIRRSPKLRGILEEFVA